MDEDPREAILKYADVAAKNPKFIAPAYAETQPEPLFQKSDSEDEEKQRYACLCRSVQNCRSPTAPAVVVKRLF